MTKVIEKTNEFVPVSFRLYHNFTYGVNKGKPNPATFFTLVLQRFVGCDMKDKRYETVGTTIGRVKEMLKESNGRYQILTALETDAERALRHKDLGLEVVQPKNVPITIVEESMSTRLSKPSNYDPINGDSDEASHAVSAATNDEPMRDTNIEGERDNGRITSKRAKKAVKEARVAA